MPYAEKVPSDQSQEGKKKLKWYKMQLIDLNKKNNKKRLDSY